MSVGAVPAGPAVPVAPAGPAVRPRPAAALGGSVLLLAGTLLAGVAASSAPGGHQLATTLLPAVVGVALLLLAGLRFRAALPGLRAIARPTGVGLVAGAVAAVLLLATGGWVFVGGAIAGSVLQCLLGAELVGAAGLLGLIGFRRQTP